MHITKVKDMVIRILADDPKARNNDTWLITQVWQKMQHIKCFIPYEEIDNMIPPETITRVRRKIQNEMGLYLPTNPDVLDAREQKEKDIKEWATKDKKGDVEEINGVLIR
jgi:hypothetical protein